MQKIVLGKSLAPFDFEKQIIAVKSWIKNRFHVVSCNTKKEIEILEKNFYNFEIEFVEIERDANDIVGKPLPYIQNILDIVSQKTEHICGYINSYIIISDMPDGMYEFLEEETADSLTFVRRNEIDCLDDIGNMKWKNHFDGIDLFFIDRKFVRDFFNDGFFVQSVWDLSILIRCELLRIKVKELMNPIAFHVRHALKWDYETSLVLFEKFYHKYFGNQDNVHRKALDLYYNIVCDKCEQICFYKSKNSKCLFAVKANECCTIESIENQDYDNIDIVSLIDQSEKKDKYDYIFYVKNGVILSKVFCRTIMNIMEQFNYKRMEIGRFFVSFIENKFIYNELCRNINFIEQINEESQLNRRSLYYLQIMGFLDNKKEKLGMEIFGLSVCSVKELKKNDDAYTIIASKRCSRNAELQLLQIINEYRILNASKIIYVDNEGGMYFFNCKKNKKKCVWGEKTCNTIALRWIGECA